MLGLEELEIGVMFWAKEDAQQTLKEVRDFGVRAGQIGFAGDLDLTDAAEKWDRALTGAHFTAVTAVCSYTGEQYTDIGTVEATVGLVPLATRQDRVARTQAVSDLARALAIDSLSCHLGFLPGDSSHADYRAVCDMTRMLCDYCQNNGQRFTLETGQEPAKVLLQFMQDVGSENLKINFDPANMIMYGTGDPIEALSLLYPHVISVHCKDGDWPDRDDPNALGEEKPLGEGSVGIDRFIHRLKELGYRGVLNIERETSDAEQRKRDIASAVKLLRWLTGRD